MKTYIITRTYTETGQIKYWTRASWSNRKYRGYTYWTKAAAKAVMTRKNFCNNLLFKYSIEERE
jgi:hypothetical protein